MPSALGNIPLDERVLTEADVLHYDSQVEYLESDGTPYINTGYLLTDNTEIEVRAALTQSVQNAPAFFGSRVDRNGTNGVVSWWDSDEFWCYAPGNGNSSETKVSMSFPVGTQFIFKYAGDGIYVNGIKKTTYRTKTPLTNQLPLWIFAINNGGVHYNPRVPCRIYNFRIYESGVLVRDFIPVRKNGVGYLYDKVSGQLFGNAGTGAFQYGEDVQADVLIPRLANAVAVNTAISTINSNLNGIDEWLASGWKETAQLSVGSIASGWSFSPDGSTWNNKVRFFHWGQLGYIMGALRKSSALAANTNSTSVGIITWPSGYTLIGAGGGLGDQRMNIVINGGGSITMLNISAVSANDALTIRAFVPLGTIGGSWTRTEVETI